MELKKNSDVKSKRRCLHQTSHFFSYSEEAEYMLVRDTAAGGDHSGFGQAYSDSVSELKLSKESLPCLSLSLDADIEMYNKKRIKTGCTQLDESKVESDALGRVCDCTHCNCRACDDHRQSDLGEDSQLEYLSAHEQDFDDRNSSSESSEQKKTIGIETTNLIDPVYEVPGAGVTQEQNLVALSEDCSPASECGIGGQTCPELPHLLHLSLTDSSAMTCDHQEEQTEYHSAVCGSVLEDDSWGSNEMVYPNLLVCESLEKGKVKDILLTDSTLPPQIATSEEVSEKNARCLHSILVKQDNPLLPPRERAQAVAQQCRKRAEDSDFYSCEESDVCAHGASCADATARGADTRFPDSEILTNKSPFFGVEGADKSSHGNTSCLNLELEHRKTLKDITGGSAVNQAVDASSDFRACFTTSRSTSAQVCLSSRAVNTVITMMNKSQPTGWHREACVDVACNTEWPCGSGSTEKICLQLTEMLESHSDANTTTAERSSQIQEQRESKNELCSSNLKISTVRPVQLDEQAVNNSAPSYCQEILQRAIEAELQILSAHYQMCYQHCLKIYSLALEQNACFSRCNGNTELRSTVMLVLEELKKNYESTRRQIKRGTPLNALPPLSVKLKLLHISSFYVPCKLFREDLCHDSVSGTREADFEALNLQEWKISADMNDPQTVCLADGSHPSDSTSSKIFEEQHKDQDMEHGCVKNEEGNQHWFDAKEDLTVDFSVIPEEMKNQPEKRETVDLQEAKITKSGNEHSFIRVNGQSSSVLEGELRSHCQKYQVSDILTSVDFSNRDAVLSFKDPNKAKLAVEEMDQKKIKGKPVSVESVNSSSQNKYLFSQVLTNNFWYEIQPVDNSQGNDQDKTLTSASNSVKVSNSASEKAHFLPVTTSNISCSSQVPSETKCSGLKSATEGSVCYLLRLNQKDTGENILQKTSAPFSTNSDDAFISPNMFNLSSFVKLMKKLQEIHPEANRDKIVNALLEVKKDNNGILSGLPISSIMERTSVILRKRSPSCGWEKQHK